MIHKLAAVLLCVFLPVSVTTAQDKLISTNDKLQSTIDLQDTVSAFISLLNDLALNSDNIFFKQHCSSILKIIQAKDLSEYGISFVKKMFVAFSDTNVASNASKLASYTERKRPFIISWTSPIDSVVSLAWLLLPENWNPELEYPLYVTLHGLYAPYADPVEYMARYLSPELAVDKSFDDGYSLFPWGRGNLWYEGIGETDVWESIAAAESLVKINSKRKYLVGHSMGGYGAWVIGQKSVETWAALGIHAGALGYGGSKYLTADVAQKLKDVPVYFICGTQDGLMSVNQTAYQLLHAAGNEHLFFLTFNGGHDALLENWEQMYDWVRQFTNERVTKTDDKAQIPICSMLFQNYPNPFNPATQISYALSASGFVSLKVYDVLGKEVATLVNELKEAGSYEVKFDALKLSSGIYFYRITAGSFIQTKKMVVAK